MESINNAMEAFEDYDQESASRFYLPAKPVEKEPIVFRKFSRYHRAGERVNTAPQRAAVLPRQPFMQRYVPIKQNVNRADNIEQQKHVLQRITEVITEIKAKPQDFHMLSNRIVAMLTGKESFTYIMTNVVEIIFEESITKKNFHCLGSQLFRKLAVLETAEDAIYRETFLNKLNYHLSLLSSNVLKRNACLARDTAMFLTKLCLQFLSLDSFLLPITNAMIQTYDILLHDNLTSKDNIRNICTNLKLAGHVLIKKQPNQMKRICSLLEQLFRKEPRKFPMVRPILILNNTVWMNYKPDTVASNAAGAAVAPAAAGTR